MNNRSFINVLIFCCFFSTNFVIYSQENINIEQTSVEFIIKEIMNDSTLNYNNYYINKYTNIEGPMNLDIANAFNNDSVVLKDLSDDPFHYDTDNKYLIKLIVPEDFEKQLFDKRNKINISNKRYYRHKYFIRITFLTSYYSGCDYILQFDENGHFEKIIKGKWIQ